MYFTETESRIQNASSRVLLPTLFAERQHKGQPTHPIPISDSSSGHNFLFHPLWLFALQILHSTFQYIFEYK